MTWRSLLPWILVALAIAAAALGAIVYFRCCFRLNLLPKAWS